MTTNYEKTLQIINTIRELTNDLGHYFGEAKEGETYKEDIGAGVDTWSDYLSQPEIGATVREANELIKVYDFCRANGIDYMLTSFATLKYMARRGIVDDEMVDASSVLTTKDFKERFYDHETEDKGKRTYAYMVMRRCLETGNLYKVHGYGSNEVLEAFKDIDEDGGIRRE